MTERPARAPRHRPEAGYARGEETRRRIIEVALRLFAERGFEGASTREIAKQAGVNAPALQYYFDNKEGVYQACAKHIVDSSIEHFLPAVERAEEVLERPDASRDDLFAAFGGLLDAIAEHQLLPDDAEHRRLFMAHEQVGHGPNLIFQMMDKTLRPRMARVTTHLVSRYSGMDLKDPTLSMRILMMMGQLMVFSLGRRMQLAKLGWERFGPKEVATIKQAAREQCRVLMDHWREAAE
ncbi:CerR family C-terminal domain-containing protein [Roseateles depolymerans]|uniref:TetR family transcriptional regulator n=1 Tax=Roseateles depolymerans TaxID=76731 RepID=A0A0U3CY58_9BURK|nr:CerR family C-terminal domain-containing protein [Roseateles depolymerans]ALV06310.1 TetR family transcriptional regulator [Roseateles depolymerans]REG19281.1 TetR family transcriptional regulator [Roseateles depolymerans]